MYGNENEFLQTLLGRSVMVYLVNGIRLVGTLEHVFDSGDILLSRDNTTQLIRVNGQGTIFPNNKEQY